MGRLDCKVASHLALRELAMNADRFVTLSDESVNAMLPALAEAGFAGSASGAAGIVAALELGAKGSLGADARVLTFLSEGPVED